jgi:hypothetical protein
MCASTGAAATAAADTQNRQPMGQRPVPAEWYAGGATDGSPKASDT